MKLFRYFDCKEHAQVWVDGGKTPINLASSYLSDDRSGIGTPDEVLNISTGGLPASWLGDGNKSISIAGTGGVTIGNIRGSRGIVRFSDNWIDGELVHGDLSFHPDDGLILCFVNEEQPTRKMARRLGKKRTVVVEITDLDLVKSSIDTQIGVASSSGDVAYTPLADRNPFLKSVDDSWQSEYRLLWRKTDVSTFWATLPPGCGRFVNAA